MLSWLIRTSLALLVTPTELERVRAWAYHTAVGQALTLAHAQGYRRGYIACADDVVMADQARAERDCE